MEKTPRPLSPSNNRQPYFSSPREDYDHSNERSDPVRQRTVRLPDDLRIALRCFCGAALTLLILLSGLRPEPPALTVGLPLQACALSDDLEADLLARVLAAEVGECSYGTQAAYAAMLLNRVADPRFPGGLGGVIAEAGLSAETGEVPQRCRRAARAALLGVDQTGGALYCFSAHDRAAAALFADRITLRLEDMFFAR